VQASDKSSRQFYREGSPKKGGCAYYVSVLAPDLSTLHIAQYSVNDPPPNAPVQSTVDDINHNVGFWADQADFRFPERIDPGLTNFADEELEAIFEDQVAHFVDYQTRVALRAIQQNRNADLVLVYIEQPDGSEHQFLLTDPRQATSPTNPQSIFRVRIRRKSRVTPVTFRMLTRPPTPRCSASSIRSAPILPASR
jgi:hypothetical protein